MSVANEREFRGVVKLTWYGSECNIDVGDDCIDEYLIDLEGKRVRVTVEVESDVRIEARMSVARGREFSDGRGEVSDECAEGECYGCRWSECDCECHRRSLPTITRVMREMHRLYPFTRGAA